MSVRELVFEYTTKGARAAARADQKVRDSVRQTGRAAQRNSGAVERWMERSRKAVQMLATATLAATGAILSASPTLRAELGGVRAAFTLFADTIIQDVLPASGSLAGTAVDAAQAYRDLDDSIRPVISTLGVIGTVMAGVFVVASGPAAVLVGTFLALTAAGYKLLGAVVDLSDVLSGYRKIATGVARILQGDFSGGLRIAREGFVDLWRAGAETREKVRLFIAQMVNDVIARLIKWRVRLGKIAAAARDALVEKITTARDRVLDLLSLGREMAEKAKEWIAGLARGVSDRASNLVSEFRDMATDAANALKNTFNEIMPDSLNIPRISVDLPDALGGGVSAGPWSIDIPQLNTGGRIASDGLAMLHAGERIMPAAQVRERGPQPTGDSGTTVEEVTVVVMGSGNAQADGRNVARAFQRELEDRGA